MSRDFPELVDPWRMVERRRGFSGTWPLERCQRLRPSLHAKKGEVVFEIDFGVDELGIRFADVSIEADLTLLCQRTLEPFVFRADRRTRLGLLECEEDEPGLPAGYEPFLVAAEPMALIDLVEDELILALPVVPLGPDGPLDASFGPRDADPVERQRANPFAVLADMKIEQSEN